MSDDYVVWVPEPRGESQLTGVGPDDVRTLSGGGVSTTAAGSGGGPAQVDWHSLAARRSPRGRYVLGPVAAE